MDIKNIRTFLKVADLKNFTRAAEELNYAQSTVTMQIQQMENELGFALFDRIGKGIFLTPYGKEFLKYANEISSLMEKVDLLWKDKDEFRVDFKIGTLESLLHHRLLNVFPLYKETYPNINLEINIGQTQQLISDLEQNNLDLIYISSADNTDSTFKTFYSSEESFTFCASSNHEILENKNLKLEDVLAYPIIVTEVGGYCYQSLDKLCREHGLELKKSMVLSSTIAIEDLMNKQSHITYLPEYSVEKSLKDGSIKKLEVADTEEEKTFCQILVHKDKWISPYMKDFISLVNESFPG